MAQKRPKLVQNMHFWSFSAKYCHFLHILSNARPKTNVNKVPRWVFRYVGNKTLDFSSKKKDFLPKNNQSWPKIGIFGQFGPGHAGSALLVGRLVVVSRGLYLARHLFTLSNTFDDNCGGGDDDGYPALHHQGAQPVVGVMSILIAHKQC